MINKYPIKKVEKEHKEDEIDLHGIDFSLGLKNVIMKLSQDEQNKSKEDDDSEHHK